MKTYFVDANVFLRFILKDNETQWDVAVDYFNTAKRGEIRLIFITEVIAEIEYVLRKLYKIDRSQIVSYISSLISMPYILIPDRTILHTVLAIYPTQTLDLVDIILCCKAQKDNADVLSFDADVEKIMRKLVWNWL